jgi:allantoinase
VTWTLQASGLHSTAGWTPYEGKTMRGRIRTTLVRGRVVYDGQLVTAEPGTGEFVPPVGNR